jgi:tRNA(Ile)-lysidine synthase TilS/MesJ
MALAWLLKQAAKTTNLNIYPVAFVVNHGAREGSTQEALQVGEMLRSIGTYRFGVNQSVTLTLSISKVFPANF